MWDTSTIVIKPVRHNESNTIGDEVMRKGKKLFTGLLTATLAVLLSVSVFAGQTETKATAETQKETTVEIQKETVENTVAEPNIPAYKGTACIAMNDNMPDFSIRDLQAKSFLRFSKLDKLKRTGTGMACLGKDLLPTETRTQMGDVQPSGWQNVKYDDLIEDGYLYNRSHVIGHQLCGDNGSAENLFTGTSYLNSDSMLYFENIAAGYLEKNKDGHVLYRVTPVYEGNNLVATGVQMEAFSIEDFGKSVCYNVFLYNVQPGISIDYKTGESKPDAAYKKGSEIGAAAAYEKIKKEAVLPISYVYEPITKAETGTKETSASESEKVTKETVASETKNETKGTSATTETEAQERTYVLNTNTKRYHLPNCNSVADIKDKNKEVVTTTKEKIEDEGYRPCQRCKP